MSISNLIVHEIQKHPNQQKALLVARPTEIAMDEQANSLSKKINDLFNRSGMNTGRFTHPAGSQEGSQLPALLKQYFTGASFSNFTEFSKECAVEYIRHLEPLEEVEGGFLWFHHYQVNEVHFLLIALLKRKQGVVLNSELSLEKIDQIEMEKLHMALRINLSAWQADDDIRYIAFRFGQARKIESDYFRAFLGCDEPAQASKETRKLVDLTSFFCQQQKLPQKEASELKQVVSDECFEKLEENEPVELTDIASKVASRFSEEDARTFMEMAESESFQLEREMFVEKASLRKLTRYSGSDRSLTLSFDSELLGESIVFDENNGSLTITELPKSLLNQLKKNVYSE